MSLIRKFGGLHWRVQFDHTGFWITGKGEIQHNLWLWIGPSISKDGIKMLNFVFGLINISFGWGK